jgi:hypothetical protein
LVELPGKVSKVASKLGSICPLVGFLVRSVAESSGGDLATVDRTALRLRGPEHALAASRTQTELTRLIYEMSLGLEGGDGACVPDSSARRNARRISSIGNGL